ncbi:osmoprotectant transport system substrate-binding protein [Nakamurella sp. UYEF19]|uniref:glycine betaine ABC transporter substrate-binding protein n=1 Tax=Nakamurella sp. UYEF19 TaxID=1756392 RepID=UPI0033970BAA
MVTTLWARALVSKGVKVGIRTIDDTAGQVAALKAGQVDIVQAYNSGLLNYLDDNANAVRQSDVDAAIAAKLPAGLTVLQSTPARDDVQLVVSAATAAKYKLHSITDLAGHLSELTLLLTDDKSAKAFTNGLSNYYGLTFPTTKTTDFAGPKMIAAIKAGPSVGLMVASQYQIDDNRFVVLTDPQHLFLTENFIPLIGGKKITPAMRATLNAVSAKLTVAALRGLRKKVANGEGTFTEVADAWLASVGLR